MADTEGGVSLGPEEVRIHKLESLVRSLQMENKRLLTCVDANKPIGPSPGAIGRRSENGPHQELIHLPREGEGDDREQDMWLYVSPVRPPTPEQRLVPLQQWLRERAEVDGGGDVPSLNEVRVALFTQESSARTMFESQSAGTAGVKRSLSAKSLTAQKFLDDVRHRRRNSLPDARAPDVAVPSREESSSTRYELASGGGVRITPKWSSEERPRNIPIKPVLPLGNSPVLGVESQRSPNTVGNVMADNDIFSGGLGPHGSRTPLEHHPAQPPTTTTEVDPEQVAVLHGTDHMRRSPLARRKVPGSPKLRHRVVDPEQVHHRAMDLEQYQHTAVDPDQIHDRGLDPEQYQHRALDPEQYQHRAVDPEQYQHRAVELDQAQRRSPFSRRKALGSPKLQLSTVDPDQTQHGSVDPDQIQYRTTDPHQVHHRAVDPEQYQHRAVDPEQYQHRAVDPEQVHHRAVDPDQAQHRSPLTQRKVIGSPRLQLSAVDVNHVQHRAVDPDQTQRRSVDPDQIHYRTVDPDQVHHRVVDPDQVHHRAVDPDQVQRRSPLTQRKVIGSPRLQLSAVDVNHVQHRAVDPDQYPHMAVDPDQAQRRKVIGSPKVQRRAMDPDHVQHRAVDPSRSPRRAVDPDHVQQKVVDPGLTQPKAVDLAKTSKRSVTRKLLEPSHLQRPGQVGVSSSSPTAVGQAPGQHPSRTKRGRDGLQPKQPPTRSRGMAYSSPSVNGPSTKTPPRPSTGRAPTVAQDTGWMDGCF